MLGKLTIAIWNSHINYDRGKNRCKKRINTVDILEAP